MNCDYGAVARHALRNLRGMGHGQPDDHISDAQPGACQLETRLGDYDLDAARSQRRLLRPAHDVFQLRRGRDH